MKQRGTGRLARQLDGKGAFAEVALELEPQETLSISFEGCNATERHPGGEIHYGAAVTFGIRFALERLTFVERRPQHYRVRVLSIYTMAVDSTEGFVAYAAAKACYAALGRADEPMEIDMQRRAVILPASP